MKLNLSSKIKLWLYSTPIQLRVSKNPHIYYETLRLFSPSMTWIHSVFRVWRHPLLIHKSRNRKRVTTYAFCRPLVPCEWQEKAWWFWGHNELQMFFWGHCKVQGKVINSGFPAHAGRLQTATTCGQQNLGHLIQQLTQQYRQINETCTTKASILVEK